MSGNLAQDAAFISANAASYIASTYTTTAKDAKAPSLVLDTECLKSLNAFLDYFLAIVIRDAKSTDLQDLKGTLALLLDSALGYVALNEAQAELETYRNQETGAGRKFEFDSPRKNGQEEVFDVESIWLQARIRCMIYSTVGEKEESDFPALSDDNTPVTPPVAIFLTAVLEFLGEHILLTSGRFARDRLGSNAQGALTQHDLERGIKMDKALNAIWTDYQAIIPSVIGSTSPETNGAKSQASPSVAQAPVAQNTDQYEQRSLVPTQEPVILRKASPALTDSRPATSQSMAARSVPSDPQYVSDFESMMSEPAITAMSHHTSSNVASPAMASISEASKQAVPEPVVAPLNLQKKTAPAEPEAVVPAVPVTSPLSELIGSPNSTYSPQPTPGSTTSSVYNNDQTAKSPGLWSRSSARSTTTLETQKQATLWRKIQADALEAQQKEEREKVEETKIENKQDTKEPDENVPTRSPTTRSAGLSSSRWSQISAEDEDPKLLVPNLDPDAYQWKSRRMKLSGQEGLAPPLTGEVREATTVEPVQRAITPPRAATPPKADETNPLIFGSVTPRKAVGVGLANPKPLSPTRMESGLTQYGSTGHAIGLALRDMTTEPGSDYERFLQSEQQREKMHASESETRRQRIGPSREVAAAPPVSKSPENEQPRYDELPVRSPPIGLVPSKQRASSIVPRSASASAPAVGPSQTMQLAQFLRNTGPVRSTPRAIPLLSAVSSTTVTSPVVESTKSISSPVERPSEAESEDEDTYHGMMHGSHKTSKPKGESLAEFLTNVPPPPSIISDPQINGAQRLPLRVSSAPKPRVDDTLIAGPAYGAAQPASRIVSSPVLRNDKKSIIGRPLFSGRRSSADLGVAPADLSSPSHDPKRDTITDVDGRIRWPANKQKRMTSRSAVAIPDVDDDEDEDSDDSIFGAPKRKPKQRESLVDFLRDTAPPGFQEPPRQAKSTNRSVSSLIVGKKDKKLNYRPLMP